MDQSRRSLRDVLSFFGAMALIPLILLWTWVVLAVGEQSPAALAVMLFLSILPFTIGPLRRWLRARQKGVNRRREWDDLEPFLAGRSAAELIQRSDYNYGRSQGEQQLLIGRGPEILHVSNTGDDAELWIVNRLRAEAEGRATPPGNAERF